MHDVVSNQDSTRIENRQLIHSAMVVDADSVCAAPGAMLVEHGRIIAAGSPESIGHPGDAARIDMRDRVLMPAFVNAHAHLDLSHLAPTPLEGTFIDWINWIRTNRRTEPAGIADAVRRGVDLCLRGGVALVGDIAGAWSTKPIEVLRRSALGGVSFLEVFGIGSRTSEALERLQHVVASIDRERCGVALGIQPHAPYSCSPPMYRACVGTGLPIATHLAETKEEIQFTLEGRGSFATFLASLGLWDADCDAFGRHPVEMFLDAIPTGRDAICAHLNYIDEAHVEQLATHAITLAYCPRASAYFGHHVSSDDASKDAPWQEDAGHPYRVLLKRGVNVALGTDGLPCLDTSDRISPLDDARVLYRRDGMDARTLLSMLTIRGARGLGVDEGLVRLTPGDVAGVVALRAGEDRTTTGLLHSVFVSDDAPMWVLMNASCARTESTE